LGRYNQSEVARLPAKRLVDEGIFELGMPYYSVDNDGRILDNVADVLYFSRLDPSMSVLKSETSKEIAAPYKAMSVLDALAAAGIVSASQPPLAAALNSRTALFFGPRIGARALRDFALIQAAGPDEGKLAIKAQRVKVSVWEPNYADRQRLGGNGKGRLTGDLFSFELTDESGKRLNRAVGQRVLVKLPYRGLAQSPRELRVLYSANGKSWRALPARNLLAVQARGLAEGYVVVKGSGSYGHLAVTDLTRAGIDAGGKAPVKR
jgi:hypothetical protein